MEKIENQDAQESNVEETQTPENLEANETDNDNSTRQSDGESGGDSLNDKLKELGISREDYFNLKGKEGGQEGGKKAEESNQQVDASDDVMRARLEARSVLDADDQDYVLRAAKALGVSPVDALTDPVVADRLASNKQARDKAEATPSASSRSGQTSAKETPEYWLDKDELPPKENKELRRKVMHLKQKAKTRKHMFNN